MTAPADHLPSVSVVIPSYIGGEDSDLRLRFLTECLDSVKAQSLRDWETIVVDDGSVDGVSVSARVEEQRDDRMRCIRHEANRGLGAARNTGFTEARGRLLLPLDADDRLAPEFLERTAGLLSRLPEVDCVFTPLRVFGNLEEVRQLSVRPWTEILREQWLPGPGTLMRRRVWETVGGYAEVDEMLGNEDWDFWIAALSRGFTAVALPEPLYWYRQWGGSLSFRYPPQDGHHARWIIYRRHRDIFRKHRSGRRFLADGYLNGATAARRAGRPQTAITAAARGIILDPLNPRLWAALVRRMQRDARQ